MREYSRCSALYTTQKLAINNSKVLHDQERHQWDWLAGLQYAEHSGWTDYLNRPVHQGLSDPSPHWLEGVGSSFIPP
ncbi:hypothetical protein Hanom_Chr16g01439731 [Helianthus anomalus]